MYKIGIWGVYPRPIGGVSIHIKRLVEALKSNSEFDCKVYNISKEKNYYYRNIRSMKLYLFKYIVKANEDIIHCHERQWLNLYLLINICKLKKIKFVLTFHSFREIPEEFNKVKFYFFKYVIDNSDRIIAVNNDIKFKLLKYTKEKKIDVIPAYINPKISEFDNQVINHAMDDKDIVVVANASRLVFYNNEDLYGLDLLIELCKNINECNLDKKIFFIFCVPIIIEVEHYEKLMKKIQEYKLNDLFLIVNEEVNFSDLINKADIFIRPTNTDGDSISIREAIYLNKPTIASDVIDRPLGCITFKNRDVNDLQQKLLYVIESYHDISLKLSEISKNDASSSIIKIYKEVLEG